MSDVRFKLFSRSNPKVAKGEKYGVWTLILHLAPAKLSGFEVCPMRTKGCTQGCLNVAGHGGIAPGGILTHDAIMAGKRNTVQAARIAKTKRFFEAREAFMSDLIKDIRKAIVIAEETGVKLAIRLNGTSDIRWETIAISGRMIDGEGLELVHRNVMDMFPDVQFYDYTKIANRKNLPANYSLTFSLADGNAKQAAEALNNGINVAVVFRNRTIVERYMAQGYGLHLPTGYVGSRVLDGDDSDLRFMDPKTPKGSFVGLYAKGNAKRDTSGFVRD